MGEIGDRGHGPRREGTRAAALLALPGILLVACSGDGAVGDRTGRIEVQLHGDQGSLLAVGYFVANGKESFTGNAHVDDRTGSRFFVDVAAGADYFVTVSALMAIPARRICRGSAGPLAVPGGATVQAEVDLDCSPVPDASLDEASHGPQGTGGSRNPRDGAERDQGVVTDDRPASLEASPLPEDTGPEVDRGVETDDGTPDFDVEDADDASPPDGGSSDGDSSDASLDASAIDIDGGSSGGGADGDAIADDVSADVSTVAQDAQDSDTGAFAQDGGEQDRADERDSAGTDAAGTDDAAATGSEPIEIPSLAWSREIHAPGYLDGAPIGGLGAGAVIWRLDGSFYLDRLDIGGLGSPLDPSGASMTVDPDDGFYFFQQSPSIPASVRRLDQSGVPPGDATYYALFPRAWVDYSGPTFSCKARVEQLSPAIPGDYRHTSYPVGVYRWQITNPTSEPCDVGIMLAWHNRRPASAVASVRREGDKVGIVLSAPGTDDTTLGEFALATREAPGLTVSYQSAPSSDRLVAEFGPDGLLADSLGNDSLGALAIKARADPGASVVFPLVLAWDIPTAGVGTQWYREYTRYFGRSGRSAWTIANSALDDLPSLHRSIENWQNEILRSTTYPDYLKTQLFNELYYYFVAGTLWEAGAASGQPDDPNEDMFSSLESFIYPFYGTSDVRFYGSWALAQLWPEIDKQEVRQFCDSVTTTRADRPAPLGTCAHDFGGPGSVFRRWNSYIYRDSTVWKDLNSKLTLMVYRDWMLTGKTDRTFLGYCWPAVQAAMQRVHGQDSDGDGLPNSVGVDQTYDNMNLSGNTAYCGSLFLAASEAAIEMAHEMGDDALAATYQSWLDAGRPSFESLWSGSFYQIDTGPNPARIMSDQLAGEWYARACGLPPIVDPQRAASAFQSIYEKNFRLFAGGTRGVVNVMYPGGLIDVTSEQTQECWVGTSWGVAAGMIQEGLVTQANEIGQSLYNTIWNGGLWFRTPEAWTVQGYTRAPYYMRAPTIWAVKHAFDLPHQARLGESSVP